MSAHSAAATMDLAPTPTPTVDDWDLLRAEAGAAGLEQLFERHRDYVFRLAVGFVGDPSTAEDVTQEVFLRLARSRRPWLLPRAKFTTWLYRLTLNVCREQRRKRREIGWADAPGGEAATLDAAALDAAALDAAAAEPRDAALGDLLQALDALSARQREAVVLRHLEGLDTREAAAVMGCRAGSVKTHLHRGLAALRQILDGDSK